MHTLFHRCKRLLISFVLVFNLVSNGYSASCHYHLCFTPQNNCTAQIVQSITQARTSIYVQAYSFTSKPIVSALLVAKGRGVKVKVILDKSHLSHPEVGLRLAKSGIPVWIDRPSGIAHNKVMIIDKQTVITGSFNFSYAAQYKNRENVIFIKDKEAARDYLRNWRACKVKSFRLIDAQEKKKPAARRADHRLFNFFTLLGGGVVLLCVILNSTI